MFSSSFIFKAFCCSINISHSVIFRKNECWVFYLLDAVLHLYKIPISSLNPAWRIDSTIHDCYWWFIGPLTYIGYNIWSCKDYETHCTNLKGCDESEKGKKNETEKELTTLKWSGNNTETSPPRSDRRLTT